jgi:hypothetical protein
MDFTLVLLIYGSNKKQVNSTSSATSLLLSLIVEKARDGVFIISLLKIHIYSSSQHIASTSWSKMTAAATAIPST